MMSLAWESLSFRRKSSMVLEDVTLALEPGKVIGLVGPNGAGKTALLRLAVGLDRPSAGTVRLGSTPLAALNPQQRARRLAYLPQIPEAAWPIPVWDAVMLGRLPHRDQDPAPVERALDAVGLSGLSQRSLTELSGGERALALLARALAVGAPILLLDEPTASLDPAHQLQVMAVLRQRAAEGDQILVVMHDLTLAARHCDGLCVLHQGRLVAKGTADLLTDTLLADIFKIRVDRSPSDPSFFCPTGRIR